MALHVCACIHVRIYYIQYIYMYMYIQYIYSAGNTSCNGMIGESSSASKCFFSNWKKRVLPQHPEANESAAHLLAGVPFWMYPSDGGWMLVNWVNCLILVFGILWVIILPIGLILLLLINSSIDYRRQEF